MSSHLVTLESQRSVDTALNTFDDRFEKVLAHVESAKPFYPVTIDLGAFSVCLGYEKPSRSDCPTYRISHITPAYHEYFKHNGMEHFTLSDKVDYCEQRVTETVDQALKNTGGGIMSLDHMPSSRNGNTETHTMFITDLTAKQTISALGAMADLQCNVESREHYATQSGLSR